jgi:hypothetical protein
MPVIFDLRKLPLHGGSTLDNEKFGRLWRGMGYMEFSGALMDMMMDLENAAEFVSLMSTVVCTTQY